MSGEARGYSWATFEDGNTAAAKHGAYSRRMLEGDAAALAPELELAMPDAPAPVISLMALTMAQLLRADRALAEADGKADREALKRDAHRWAARLESIFARAGLLGAKDGPAVQIALAANPEWVAVKGRIVGALQQHPQALDAVVGALEDGA